MNGNGLIKKSELDNGKFEELEHVLTLILPIDTALNDKIFVDNISDKNFLNLINRGDLYSFDINFPSNQNDRSFKYKKFFNNTVFILLLISRTIKFQEKNFNFLDLVQKLNERYNYAIVEKVSDKKLQLNEIKSKLEKIGIKFHEEKIFNDNQYFENYDENKALNFLNSLLLCKEGYLTWEQLKAKFRNIYDNRENAEVIADSTFSLILLADNQFISKIVNVDMERIDAIKKFFQVFIKSLDASNLSGFLQGNDNIQNYLNNKFHHHSFCDEYWRLIESLLDKKSLSYQELNSSWQSIESLLNYSSFMSYFLSIFGFADNKKPFQLDQVKQQYITTLLQKFKMGILDGSVSKQHEGLFNKSVKDIESIIKALAETEKDKLEICSKKNKPQILELSEFKAKVQEKIEDDKENKITFATACLEICYKLIGDNTIFSSISAEERNFSSLNSEAEERKKIFDTLNLLTLFLLQDKIQCQPKEKEVSLSEEDLLGQLLVHKIQSRNDILSKLKEIRAYKLSIKTKNDEFKDVSETILNLLNKFTGIEFDHSTQSTFILMLSNNLKILFITKESLPFLKDGTNNNQLLFQVKKLLFECQCELLANEILGLNVSLSFKDYTKCKNVVSFLKEILDLNPFELIRHEELSLEEVSGSWQNINEVSVLHGWTK